ncbi:MAG: RNA polymerase sigma-32 factor [Candidatus Azotimanducaceae bacterium]|jgi:RNA polymerase sigma-32 factor
MSYTKSNIDHLTLGMLVGGLRGFEDHSINKLPRLTAEQERVLALACRKTKDAHAATMMFYAYLRLVIKIARRYHRGFGLPAADLIQEGTIGLMKAVEKFDPDVGVRLYSYAPKWIKAEIRAFVMDNHRMVRVPESKTRKKLFFNLWISKVDIGPLTRLEAEGLAEHFGVSIADVLEMDLRLSLRARDFDPSQTHEDGSTTTHQRHLVDENAIDPAKLVEDAEWAPERRRLLDAALEQLSERDADVIRSCIYCDDDKKETQRSVALRHGVAERTIKNWRVRALAQLKQILGPDFDLTD